MAAPRCPGRVSSPGRGILERPAGRPCLLRWAGAEGPPLPAPPPSPVLWEEGPKPSGSRPLCSKDRFGVFKDSVKLCISQLFLLQGLRNTTAVWAAAVGTGGVDRAPQGSTAAASSPLPQWPPAAGRGESGGGVRSKLSLPPPAPGVRRLVFGAAARRLRLSPQAHSCWLGPGGGESPGLGLEGPADPGPS